MDNILILIAARGGSKGVKNKNIKMINGKPLIAYTIEQALSWNKTKYVTVSTDSPKIAGISRKYGAQVPFIRPQYLSGDSVGKLAVLKHALQKCEKLYNIKFSIIMDLDVTAPIRRKIDLDRCLKIFVRQRPKTLVSVVEASKNPYFNMVEIDTKGKWRLSKNKKGRIVRRQDAPKVFSLNASIFLCNRRFLLNNSHYSPVTNNTEVYVMPDIASVDIDNEVDFSYIGFLIKRGIVKI